MSLKNLQAFVYVVEEKSFTRAAQRLFQTQPALSKQIRVLEAYLGSALVERGEKELLLTEAGLLFYPVAKKILEGMVEVIEQIEESKGELKGKLTIGASTLPGEYLLPPLLAEFTRLYPGIRVEVIIDDSKEIMNLLSNRVIRLGFVGVAPKDEALAFQRFTEDEIVQIMAPHDAQNQACILAQNLILREKGSGTRSIVEAFLREEKCWPLRGPYLELGTTRAIINAVAAGLGTSYVSRLAAEEALELGKIKAEAARPGGLKRPIYLATQKNSKMSVIVKAFCDFTQQRQAPMDT